jgi:hypothetical protein
MELIAEKHAGFISRLTKLLDLFIAMRYISPSDVIRPPHSSETIATSIFEKIGLNSEVIELIKLIPAMRSEIVDGYNWFGVELLPRSKAVTYFADSEIPDFMEDLRWGERLHRDAETKLLPPCILRLTSGSLYSGQYGTDLIYDTNDRMSIARKDLAEMLMRRRNDYRVVFNWTRTRCMGERTQATGRNRTR